MTKRIPQFHPILHAAQLIRDKLRDDLAYAGCTSAQGRVLDVIDRLDDPVPARVGEALSLSASAMSQMVQRLRKAELLEKSQRTKGRAYSERLVLSERGKILLLQARETWDQIEKDLIEIIGEDALESMFQTSYDIVEGLGATPPFPRNIHFATGADDGTERPNTDPTEEDQ